MVLRPRRVRDLLYRCHVGDLRISAVRASDTMMQQSQRWPCAVETVDTTTLWGEYMAGCAMLSAFQKGEERIKLSVQTPTIQEVYVEAMAVGEVRGKILMMQPESTTAPESAPLKGHMRITKILYGMYKPFETAVDAIGDPQQDWQTYYERSEQIPTRVRLQSGWHQDRTKPLCCGVTIQKMPPLAGSPATSAKQQQECQQQTMDLQLELDELDLTSENEMLMELLGQNGDIKSVLHELFPKKANKLIQTMQVKQIPLDYFCRCSKKAFATKLQSLGHEALQSVREEAEHNQEQGVDLNCHFCNAKYHFSVAELTQLVQ